MKTRITLLFLIITLLLLSCSKEQQQTEQKAVPVRVYTVEPDSISRYLELTGSLEAENDAMVFSKVSEKIVDIRRKVGEKVQKNDLIAVLDNQIYQQGVNQARAALQSLEARSKQVLQDYRRYERLYKEEAVSQQQWEKISSSRDEVEAGLAQSRAMLQQSLEQLENTYIRAPFDGVVGSLYFDEGQTVPVGQPVAKIISTRLMKAKLNIPDIHLNKVQAGQVVVAEFSQFPGQNFPGRLQQLDPAIDPVSRTIGAEAVFNNDERLLKSGMYGTFYIEIAHKTGTFVVPDNSVLTRTEVKVNPATGETYTETSNFVYVVNDSHAKMTAIKTGLEAGDRIEVTEGLRSGDEVIVVGQRIVKNDEEVEVISE
ncbi:MAG: efflux RND transporter periplasmic adaptor subunit [Calditrichia bacterium]